MTVEKSVADILKKKGFTMTCAESCTGGLIASRVVNVPGVSEVFKAGFVTYANEAKQKLLGVREETLIQFGAVSRQTAEEMARGAAKAAEADVAISVTGIAGPDGGTKEKPVGLVYIGCYVRGDVLVKEYHFDGDRMQVRQSSAEAALKQLLVCLQEQQTI
ncbi:MAG: CinA family protein [Lachnospiraceae bacterium]|nr:CinA family protein [Lachnospiraceae bacterium]